MVAKVNVGDQGWEGDVADVGLRILLYGRKLSSVHPKTVAKARLGRQESSSFVPCTCMRTVIRGCSCTCSNT